MHEGPRVVVWRGQEFRFERLKNGGHRPDRDALWAVSRHGEFIGTMPCAQETTKEFDVRCVHWLTALLG